MERSAGYARCGPSAWRQNRVRDERCNCIRRKRWQAHALPQSEAFAGYRQRRVVVEHRLARLVQLGIRQSRYFGRAKTRFQLYLAATVANLTLVASKAGLPANTGAVPASAVPRSLEWSTPPPHGSGKFGPSPCSYRPY